MFRLSARWISVIAVAFLLGWHPAWAHLFQRASPVERIDLRKATTTFAYDPGGNLTNDGRRGFSYDAHDRLESVQVAGAWRTQFVHDGLNRLRVRTEFTWSGGAWVTNAVVRYVYAGGLVVEERNGSNNATTVAYTRGLDLSGSLGGAGGIGGLLALTRYDTPSPSHAWYHADGSGNVTALANANQYVVARYQYDPFGGLVAQSGPWSEVNRLRFSSKEWHAASGTYAFGRRFYDPGLQRWLNPDPIGIAGGINLYAFVGNSPMTWIDPYGEYLRMVGAGALQPRGPLAYYTGDSMAEQAVAVALNTPVTVLNPLLRVATELMRGAVAAIGGAEAGMKGPLLALTGDPYLAENLPRALTSCLLPEALPLKSLRAARYGAMAEEALVAEGRAAKSVATPYGPAVQSMTAEARAALSRVENGATLYKGGVLGRSETGASQFLSLENPLNPGYAGRYGIPPPNANFEFILTGRVQPGAPVITRPAPGIPPNPGGGIEAVTTPGSFRIDSFHMP